MKYSNEEIQQMAHRWMLAYQSNDSRSIAVLMSLSIRFRMEPMDVLVRIRSLAYGN